jgi:hypothetical protein
MNPTELQIQEVSAVATLVAAVIGSLFLFFGSRLQTVANEQHLSYPPLESSGTVEFQWGEIVRDIDAVEYQAKATFYTTLGTCIMMLSVVLGLLVSFPKYFVFGFLVLLVPIVMAWVINERTLRPLMRRIAYMRDYVALNKDVLKVSPLRRHFGKLLTTLRQETDAQLEARIEALRKEKAKAASQPPS